MLQRCYSPMGSGAKEVTQLQMPSRMELAPIHDTSERIDGERSSQRRHLELYINDESEKKRRFEIHTIYSLEPATWRDVYIITIWTVELHSIISGNVYPPAGDDVATYTIHSRA